MDADPTREELHFRRIDMRGYRRSDGLLEVEGRVTDRKPTDFTLKKRYLVGVLDEIDFVDLESGAILCRIRPGAEHCSADGQR